MIKFDNVILSRKLVSGEVRINRVSKQQIKGIEGFDLAYLLMFKPEFIDKINKENLFALSNMEISMLLIRQPEFLCFLDMNKIKEMDNYYKYQVIEYQPDLKYLFPDLKYPL
jgi:hypothetical protein